ncbi:helix-turn-helix transcriptional regulator [Streptomyces sp. NPDC048188]|uniref:helix-turn-helix transcriptional regulator n=1 Tax=Streptomyces sp. NPDC048188 TaxID=3155749 RepID=UPI0034351501
MRTETDGWRLRGWLVAELRQARGIPQQVLAQEVGCSRSTVAMWESKNQRPGPRYLPRLARHLGVPPLHLVELVDAEWTLMVLRRLLGLTQRQVAQTLKVAVSTYCDVETGRQAMPDRWVPVLRALFDTDEQTIRNSAPLKKPKKR